MLKENADALATLCILNVIYKHAIADHSETSKIVTLECIFASKYSANKSSVDDDQHTVSTTKRMLLKVRWNIRFPMEDIEYNIGSHIFY